MLSCVILGAGPAGTGPLLWAAQNGRLDAWLRDGVALIERRPVMGGTIGRYVVESDSLGASYLESLDPPMMRALLPAVCRSRAMAALDGFRHSLPPLSLVGRFLELMGRDLQDLLAGYPRSTVRLRTSVERLRLRRDGSVAADLISASGVTSTVEARAVVTAIGGRQDASRYLAADLGGGLTLRSVPPDRIMPSDAILTRRGLAGAAIRLRSALRPRVVILGGSHSAFSVAWLLLARLGGLGFGAGDIRLIYRRSPRIFYATREEAEADGYPVSEADLCPATRRVNRLGGIRGQGRGLWRRLSGRPGTEPEPRVRMGALGDADYAGDSLKRLLDEAVLVVPAFGYRLATVPVFDAANRPLPLLADAGGPAVGSDSRLLLADGRAIPNMFAAGLGSGFRPWGRMGGEPSFCGQQNSLWLYQHDLGRIVYEGVQQCCSGSAARTAPAADPPFSGLGAFEAFPA